MNEAEEEGYAEAMEINLQQLMEEVNENSNAIDRMFEQGERGRQMQRDDR